MKLLIQRVKQAQVHVDSQLVAHIGEGLLVFMGITHLDTEKEIKWLANKLVHLRIFADENGQTNCSLLELKRQVLIVSQFSLYADATKGRRPSFTQAALPESAKKLYEAFITEIAKQGISVATGVFGAHMEVGLINDGPMTLLLERSFKQPASNGE